MDAMREQSVSEFGSQLLQSGPKLFVSSCETLEVCIHIFHQLESLCSHSSGDCTSGIKVK